MIIIGRRTYRKIITTPELIEQINPKNQELVDKFLKNFKTKRSEQSVNVYKSNMNIFMVWVLIYADNKLFTDLKKIDMQDFFDYAIEELKWNSSRYSSFHSCLSSFSNFIETFYDERYPDFRNLMKFIEKVPKQIARKKSIFTLEDLNKLMIYLESQELWQECCLLSLIMATGARVSELNRFHVSIIDLNHTAFDDIFLETTEESRVKGRGVHGKSILRYIIKDLFVPHYLKWLPIREKILKDNNKEHDFLFIKLDKNNIGDPAVVGTFRSWMKKWDEQLTQPWYPHAGRHTWTTYLKSVVGLEPELIQYLQNWQNMEMISVYDDSTAKTREFKNLAKLKENLIQQSKIKESYIVKDNDSEEDEVFV